MRESEGALAIIRRRVGNETRYLAQWNNQWNAFNFVGGHRRPDESYRACLIREITEELEIHADRDYRFEDDQAILLEYLAWSQSAQEETLYRMAIFHIQIAVEKLAMINLNSANRWLTSREIFDRSTHDGQVVSDTMQRVRDAIA